MQIEIRAKEIKLVRLDEIKLNPKNRNKHPNEQIDQLVKIIEYQGFRRPGTISKRSGFLNCGEGRYWAAKKLNMTHIPCMFQDYDSDEQEYADGVADNAIDKQAILDFASINQDFLNFGPEFNIYLLGIKDFVLEPSEKFDLDEKLDKEKIIKHILEVQCTNEKELVETYEELLERGLIVRYR